MSRTYREVTFILSNKSPLALTVVGAATLKGSWDPQYAPRNGDVVPASGVIKWRSRSTEIGTGTSAMVRLGTDEGYVTITWHLPWVGRFQCDVQAGSSMHASLDIDDTIPDAIVLQGTVHTQNVQ